MQFPALLRQPLSRLLACLALALALAADTVSRPTSFAERPDVQAFIHLLAARDHFPPARLYRLFNQVRPMPATSHHMNHPAEAKPWLAYQEALLTPARISGGVAFWNDNAAALSEAQRIYNIPAELIVAIIGIETGYGRNTGNYRILDTLSTLAFNYPRRRAFFQDELEQYLLMTREEQIDPLSVEGSYAGAMGLPQFMPGTFRRYAVDFNHDGRRDIWNDPTDAIGSVANYFRQMGWNTLEPAATPAHIAHLDTLAPLQLASGPKGPWPLSVWQAMGVTPQVPVDGASPARLLSLQGVHGREYWFLLPNFEVIRHYNKSTYYALTIFELGQAIAAQRKQAAAAQNAP